MQRPHCNDIFLTENLFRFTEYDFFIANKVCGCVCFIFIKIPVGCNVLIATILFQPKIYFASLNTIFSSVTGLFLCSSLKTLFLGFAYRKTRKILKMRSSSHFLNGFCPESRVIIVIKSKQWAVNLIRVSIP